MKKRAFVILSLMFIACVALAFIVGCDAHTCVYDNKIATNEHLYTQATCASRAKYYYSCACGENGTKTFLSGGFKDHVFTYYESNDDATCTSNATETARCDNNCGTTDTREVENSLIPHVYTTYTYNYDATFDKNGTESAPCDYGCGAIDEKVLENSIIVKPVYETDEYIPIIAYSTPTIANWDGMENNYDGLTFEHYKRIKDAGFTGVQPLREGLVVGGNPRNLKEWHDKAETDAMKALALCAQLDLTYMVRDWTFYGAFTNASQFIKLAIESGQTISNITSYMFREGNPCLSHPNYEGHYLADEPSTSQMDNIYLLVKRYKELVPGKDSFFNLLPMYATYEQMGVTSAQGYEGYIDHYCKDIGKELGYISYDFYPYSLAGVDKYYLRNFEIVADRAKRNDLDFRLYIQAGGLGGPNSRSVYGPEDYRHQMYTALAYGVRYFIYFTYAKFANEQHESLLDINGNRTNRYYYAQEVNNEIHKLEDVMLSFDWDSAMIKNGYNDTHNVEFTYLQNVRESHPRIKDYSVSRATLTGCFKDKAGRDGFMFVNYADPYRRVKDEITVNFNDTSLLLVYEKGEEKIVYGNTYTFTLEPGEGRFVIPLN